MDSASPFCAICTGINCGLQHYGYAFDLAGNLSTRTRYGSSTITETFTNDAANRLIQATLTTGTTTVTTLMLTYDQLGNVCSKNGVAYSYAGLAGCANHGSFGSPHATTQIGGGTSYQYDADGNQFNGPANGDTRNLTYNALNQVTTARLVASGQTTTFQYDPDGGRFQRVDNGSVTTTYVGNVEILNNGAVTENRRYLGGVAIDYVRSTLRNQTMFVFTDHLGSTDLLTNPDGTIVETMSFDAHGNYRNASTWAAGTTQQTGIGSPNTRHGFTGHEHVDSMGLVHMNGRIYDPVMGRMLQADSFTGPGPQGLNRYSYVANNPLSLTDPTGYSWWRDILGVAITAFAPEAWAYFGLEWSLGTAIATGFVAGAVQSDHLIGGVAGAFSAGVFFQIGYGFDNANWAHEGGTIGSTNLNGIGFSAKILAHGIAGGVMQSLEGGKFGNGFLSAGVGEAAAPGIDKLDPTNRIGVSVSAERVVAASIVGGTTSVLAGGKFGNGAITAAFGRAFNEESAIRAQRKYTIQHDVPAGSEMYQTSDNAYFIAPANYGFDAVQLGGQFYRSDIDAVGAFVYDEYGRGLLRPLLGQGGTFDIQRDTSNYVVYSAYTNGANFIVGYFMYSAGYSLNETIAIGYGYAALNSSNKLDPNLGIWWAQGWNTAKSGHAPIPVDQKPPGG